MLLRFVTPVLAGILCLFGGQAIAQPGGTSSGADVIVGDLQGVASWGQSGGISAFSVGTTSCNIGDENLLWISGDNRHPVIGQNMFRIKDGVMEQVGQGWLKHGFFALSQSLCSGPGGCDPTSGSTLGVGCSDPYTASRNGSQGNLGPRSQVNPSTGFFQYPPTAPGPAPTIGRRVQVPNEFLEPTAGTTGLEYWVDGQYVASDDSADGNGANNVSVRRVNVNGSGPTHSISLFPGSSTQRQTSMIEQWAIMDSDVLLQQVDTDGRFFVASKVIEVTPGVYQYEYAIYNQTSHSAIGGFEVPLGGITPTDVDFHAVTSHSGEPVYAPFGTTAYNNTPWTESVTPGVDVSWSTNPNGSSTANPIRWGTQYNFRFTTNVPPVTADATVSMWRSAGSFDVEVYIPDGNAVQPVDGLACEYDAGAQATNLSWNNGASYTSVVVRRDGSIIATLGGSETSYSDTGAPTSGSIDYSVTGVIGPDSSGPALCSVDLPAKVFEFGVSDSTINFDQTSGVGSGTATMTAVESSDNPGFPNDVAGFSMALTYDDALLAVAGTTEASPLAALDPEFFAAEDVGGGITVGVIIDFFVSEFITFSSETDLIDVEFSTVASALAGQGSAINTTLLYEDGVHGAIPISGVVDLGSESFSPIYSTGTVTLEPGLAAGQFIRADANNDGLVDIADPVAILGFLFQGDSTNCQNALDANDDEGVDIADAVNALSFLFSGGPTFPAPYPNCGGDPTAGSLSCDGPTACP